MQCVCVCVNVFVSERVSERVSYWLIGQAQTTVEAASKHKGEYVTPYDDSCHAQERLSAELRADGCMAEQRAS